MQNQDFVNLLGHKRITGQYCLVHTICALTVWRSLRMCVDPLRASLSSKYYNVHRNSHRAAHHLQQGHTPDAPQQSAFQSMHLLNASWSANLRALGIICLGGWSTVDNAQWC